MLTWNAALHRLGVAEMDATHEEFLNLAREIARAGDADFPQLFDILVEHTQRHFDNESRLMRVCRFPAIGEHEGEHRRVLAELGHMQRGIDAGRLRLARLYVSEGLPDWFRHHLATMDAALAGCLKRNEAAQAPAPEGASSARA